LIVVNLVPIDRAKRKGEAAWEEKYMELAEFKRQNGHCKFGCWMVVTGAPLSSFLSHASSCMSACELYHIFLVSGNVPTKHSSNRALGRWVSTQRSQHKKHQRGVPCHLTQDRIDKLDELDFIWRMAPAKNDDANTMVTHQGSRLMEEDGDDEEDPPEADDDAEDS
jgi:hypothetical protein